MSLEPAISQESLLITAAEFAKLLQISVRTLWRLNSARRVPESIRIGGAVRWRAEEVRNWIAEGCPTPQARENGSRRN